MNQDGNKVEIPGILGRGYGILPKDLMKARNIKPYTKLVLCYMLSYAGNKNTCFPSIKRMADEIGIGTTTVSKSIKEAVEKGFIAKTRLYPNNPMKHNSKYYLLFMSNPEIIELPIEEPKTETRQPRDGFTTTASGQSIINSNINNSNTNSDASAAALFPIVSNVIDYAVKKKPAPNKYKNDDYQPIESLFYKMFEKKYGRAYIPDSFSRDRKAIKKLFDAGIKQQTIIDRVPSFFNVKDPFYEDKMTIVQFCKPSFFNSKKIVTVAPAKTDRQAQSMEDFLREKGMM